MGVTKRIIKEGAGETPKKGDSITCHYTGTLENGTVFDSSVQRKQPFTVNIGVGQVIKGWDEGIMGMKVGEKCVLTCTPDYAYGDRGAGKVIPPGATLNFEVELLSMGPAAVGAANYFRWALRAAPILWMLWTRRADVVEWLGTKGIVLPFEIP